MAGKFCETAVLWVAGVSAVSLCACVARDHATEPAAPSDAATGGIGGALPEQSEAATKVDLGTPLTLRQEGCGTSELSPGSERIVWGGTDCGVVAVEDLTVRCDQILCGFVESDGETAKVLIRPCDMDPDQIAQCVCAIRIEFDAPESAKTVEISRQGDNLSGPQPPTLIGRAQCVPTD